MYTIGSKDKAMIMRIQRALSIPVDGIFGAATRQAVIKYQMQHNLVADGIVGRETLTVMGILDTDQQDNHFVTPSGLIINKYYLPVGEYIEEPEPVKNDFLVLHHTAGWNNPYATIDGWARDTRGAIGTEFIIGGIKSTNGNNDYDGVVVQAFPEGCRAWHVASEYSKVLNKHAVGIEVCNFGQLNDDGKTYVGGIVQENQIVTLNTAFKGFTKFHRYSDKQLYSLKRLIKYIAQRDLINLQVGLIKWIHDKGAIKAFEFNLDAASGKVKGLLVHSNCVATKLDMYPQPELVDMLVSL